MEVLAFVQKNTVKDFLFHGRPVGGLAFFQRHLENCFLYKNTLAMKIKNDWAKEIKAAQWLIILSPANSFYLREKYMLTLDCKQTYLKLVEFYLPCVVPEMLVIQKLNLHVHQLHRSHCYLFFILHTSHAFNIFRCEENVTGNSHCNLLHAFCAALKALKRKL